MQQRQTNSQTTHSQIFTEYKIVTGILALILASLAAMAVGIWIKIRNVAVTICQIFIAVDHRAILAHVTKIKSFTNMLELNQSMISSELTE